MATLLGGYAKVLPAQAKIQGQSGCGPPIILCVGAEIPAVQITDRREAGCADAIRATNIVDSTGHRCGNRIEEKLCAVCRAVRLIDDRSIDAAEAEGSARRGRRRGWVEDVLVKRSDAQYMPADGDREIVGDLRN